MQRTKALNICYSQCTEYQSLEGDGSFLFAFASDGNLQHRFLFHGMQGLL